MQQSLYFQGPQTSEPPIAYADEPHRDVRLLVILIITSSSRVFCFFAFIIFPLVGDFFNAPASFRAGFEMPSFDPQMSENPSGCSRKIKTSFSERPSVKDSRMNEEGQSIVSTEMVT